MARLRWGAPVVLAGVVLLVWWIRHGSVVGHWLQVHLGVINEAGPYYAFWSGFGSDLAEFGILGALATAVYHTVKRYNCNYPGCPRIGVHPAAGGQLHLCYRHHPDLAGTKLTQAMILDMHNEHEQAKALLHRQVQDIHQRMSAGPVVPVPPDPPAPAVPAAASSTASTARAATGSGPDSSP
jgi:hypothetical protein